MLNAEGDVHVSNEAVEGLGTQPAFPTSFVAAIASLASPQNPLLLPRQPRPHFRPEKQQPSIHHSPRDIPLQPVLQGPKLTVDSEETSSTVDYSRPILTGVLPDPGYFIAGGIAGVVSRTATAPLDRLKVYLIAQTGVCQETVHAVTKGDAVQAARHASRPLINALKELWKAGGMRSLFAGGLFCYTNGAPADVSRERFECCEGHARVCHQVWLL